MIAGRRVWEDARHVRPRFTDVGRLVVRCPDRPGIVAVLSRLMADVGANITDSQQHSSDPIGGTFTLRLEFVLADLAARRAELEGALALLAGEWRMTWRLTEATHRPTLAVFVSRTDHVLQELIYRVRAGDLRAEIACVVSNHPDLEPVARGRGHPVPPRAGDAGDQGRGRGARRWS